MNSTDDELRGYRKLLQDLEIKSLESYDKAVMTLSGSGLAISFAFIKDIIGSDAIKCTVFLTLSWIAWSLSILAVITSFLFSHYALNKAIEALDNDDKENQLGSLFDKGTRTLNILSGSLFFIGTICMVVFAINNID